MFFCCGSGSYAKYFIDKGYAVDVTDRSEELCKIASKYMGIDVRCMLFEELNEIRKYDGIWDYSSILHLSKNALADALKKMSISLKDKGIVYTSFKCGEFEGERNGYTLTIAGKYYNTLDIESFSLMMNDTSYCYKFYCLEAIVQLLYCHIR